MTHVSPHSSLAFPLTAASCQMDVGCPDDRSMSLKSTKPKNLRSRQSAFVLRSSMWKKHLPRGGSIPEEPQFTIPVFGESCHFHICPFCSRERLPGSETLESHNLFCPHSTMVSTVWAGLQAPGLFSEPETRALTLQAFRSFWGL